MAYTLVIVSGPETGRRFPLPNKRLIIGRDPAADISLDIEGASREHCALSMSESGNLSIEDLNSRNGTKVNDQAISSKTTLSTGDQLSIGNYRCTICNDRNKGAMRLLILSGPDAGQEIPLSGKQLTIGRGKTADLVIMDKATSRINSRLLLNGNAWEVNDCKSANGTRLNGDKLTDAQAMRSGDYIQVGNTLISFIDGRVEDLEGQQIDQATILKQAGKGSLGVVYEGKLLGSGQRVAVKIIDPAVSQNDATKARIINAARRAEKLSGEHIAPVLGSGTYNELHYIISDWAENGSLANLLKGSDEDLAPPMVVASILRDAARGLQEAAEESLFHSGLRPGNILLYRDGLTRVSDFGTTARFDDEQHSGGVYPYYISPEELGGRPIDAKANQFSLGAIGYHALTGEPPFAEDDIAASATARLTSSLEHVCSFNAEVPEALANVVSRLLALGPEDRYPNWNEVIKDLDQVIQGEHIAAPENGSTMATHKPSTMPRRGQTKRRGRGAAPQRQVVSEQKSQQTLLVAGIAAVILVAVVIIAGTSSGSSSDRSQLSATNSARQESVIPGSQADRNQAAYEALDLDSTPDWLREDSGGSERREVATRIPSTSTAPESQPSNESPASAEIVQPAQTTTRVATQEPPDQPQPSSVVAPTVTEPENKGLPTESPELTGDYPRRAGLLTHFAQEGTWEDGSIQTTKGNNIGVAFRFDGDVVIIRKRNGDQETIPEYAVAAVELKAPSNAKVRRGDSNLGRKKFADALASYQQAREQLPDNSYLKQQLAHVTSLIDRLAEADDKMFNGNARGNGEEVLTGVLTFIEIMEPRRLGDEQSALLEGNWPRIAGLLSDERRQEVMDIAKNVGVRLSYDPAAPGLLQEAIAAAQQAEPDHRQALKLFEDAADGNAYFDDNALLYYANSLVQSNNKAKAHEVLKQISKTGRANPLFAQLQSSLGLRAPPIKPELLVSTYIGGNGNQSITSIDINNGVIEASGEQFAVRYQLGSLKGNVAGNIAHDEGDKKYQTQTHHPKKTISLNDPRNGQTYSITTKQVHPILMQPVLRSSAGWQFWGHSHKEVIDQTSKVRWGPLMSDSRGYDVWLMPNGLIGAKFWCDGGNAILTRNPMDLSKPNPIESMSPFKKDSGGMASLFLLINPNGSTPTIEGGTFVNTHITHHAIDQWGRMYLPKGIRTKNLSFGSSAGKGGLFVLDEKLTNSVVNMRFGGSGNEVLGRIALQDNILVMAGRTASKDLITKNAVQEKHGGGEYDGWLVVLRLWPDNF